MKKIVILCFMVCSILFLALFSGCGVYDKIDLEKASKEIATLKTRVLDLTKIKEVIEKDSPNFGTLEDIEFDHLSINSEYILKESEYLFRQEKTEVNSIPLTSYIIVKPAEDKKELLEDQIELYYKGLLEQYSEKEEANEETKEHLKNVMKKEFEGYLIYILSNDNENVWKKIEENAHSLLFENTKEAKMEDFGIRSNDAKEFKAVVSNQSSDVNFYLIVRPKNGKADNIKKAMDQYMKDLDKKWSTYLPDEYERLKNHMDTEVGSYLIYIVSKDNPLVLKTIKDAVVKGD